MSYSPNPLAWGSGAVITPGTSQSDEKHSHKHSSHRKHKHSKHSDGKRSHHKHKHRDRHEDSQHRPASRDDDEGEVEDGELIDFDKFKVQDEWVDVEDGEICDSPDKTKGSRDYHGGVNVGRTGAVLHEDTGERMQYEHKRHRRKHKDKHSRRRETEAYPGSQILDERGDYGSRSSAYSGSSYDGGVDPRMDYEVYNDTKGRGRSERISHSGAILRDDRDKGAILIEDRDDSPCRRSSQRGNSPYGTSGYSDMGYKSSGQREMSNRRAHSVRRGSSTKGMGRQGGALLLDDRDEFPSYDDRYMEGKKHKEGLHDQWERPRNIWPNQREDRPPREDRPRLKEDGVPINTDRPLLREDGAVVRKRSGRSDRAASENRIRKDRPILKEDGAVIRKDRPILKEDGAVIRKDRPIDRPILRDDRVELQEAGAGRKDGPILKEDGAVVSESRPLLRENGAVVRKRQVSRDDRPILKEDGAVVREDRIMREERPKVDGDTIRNDRPILKENGAIVRESRPVLKEDGAIIRTDRILDENLDDRRDRPVLKEDGEFVRDNRSLCKDSRPVLKEDGAVVRMDKPILKEDGAIVRDHRSTCSSTSRPVLKEDGAVVRTDRPILKEDGSIVRESRSSRGDWSNGKTDIIVKQERPILKEDGAIVSGIEDRPMRDDCQVSKGVKNDRPVLKENGVIIRDDISVKEEGPVLKEDGEIVKKDRPVLREDGEIVREGRTLRDARPVLKENGEIVRNDRPVLKQDGEIVRNDRPILKEDGEIVRTDRPVLKQDGEIINISGGTKIDRPILREDGEIVREEMSCRDERPVLKEGGEIVKQGRPVLKENGAIVRDDRSFRDKGPVLKEDGEILRMDRPILKEDGAIVNESRPIRQKASILKEDREIIRNDRPIVKEDGAIVSEHALNKEVGKKRPVLREDSAIISDERPFKGDSKDVKSDRPILREDGKIVEDIIDKDDILRNEISELTEDGEIVDDPVLSEDGEIIDEVLSEDGEIIDEVLSEDGEIVDEDEPVLREDGAVVGDDRYGVRDRRSICRDDRFDVSRGRSAVRDKKPAVWGDMEESGVPDTAVSSRSSRRLGSRFKRSLRDRTGIKPRERNKKRDVQDEVDMEWDATFYREDSNQDRPVSKGRKSTSNVVRIGDLLEEREPQSPLYPEMNTYTDTTAQNKRDKLERRKRKMDVSGKVFKLLGHSAIIDAKKKSSTSRDIAVQRLKKRSENIWNSKHSRGAKTPWGNSQSASGAQSASDAKPASWGNAQSASDAKPAWSGGQPMRSAPFSDIYALRRGLRRPEGAPWMTDGEPAYKRRRRREPSPPKEKPCIRSGNLPQLDDTDEVELTEYTEPIAAWVRSSAADLYFNRDMKNPRNTITTKRQQELEKKFEHDLVERASRIIASLPPVPKQTDRPEWLKRRHCNHSHTTAKECKKESDDDSSSGSDSDDESEQWWLDEMKRKQEHPLRLHPELWYNDPGELNYEPLCRCSLKARKTGIRHNKYPGEVPLPKCDVNSNNLDKLFHYKITISPVTNFLTKHPSVITFDGREYMFEGFSIFTHEVIPPMPPCQVIRFNIVYTIHVVEEQAPENFSVRSLDLITKFLFDEILELVDIDWKGPGGDDSCNIFHVMPRFSRPFPENGKEIMSINDVLLYLLKSSKPLVEKADLDRLRRLDKEDWQKYMDDFQYMVVTNPAKKPRSIRIDQLDRAGTENKGSQFPVIVHKGLRPALLSYAGDPAYRKKWREYLKFRQLLWTRVKLSEDDKMKLEEMQMELQRIRIKCTMKKDVLVAVDSAGFCLTGIRSDMCQHAMMLPVLFGHVRFHSCLKSFQKIIRYQFKDITLLQLAFTHSSYKVNYGTNPDHGRNSLSNCGSRQLEFGDIFVHTTNRRKKGLCVLLHIMSKMAKKKEVKSDIPHNERLEFLGDAVLEFITSTRLFAMFPDCDEGDLSTFRGALVQNAHLSVLADKLHLQDYLLYAHGPDLCHTADLRHAMANCFEAIMGAMYLDGGIELADRVFAETLFGEPELLEIWMNVPKHPLQYEEPSGDRHWIANSPSLKKLKHFENDIGYEFQHIRLLARAFTQRVIGYNHLTKGHNQTLEFLGDTIMQLISSDFLYRHFPDHHEGHLTLLRSSLVSNRTQATVADELGMMNYVITQRSMNNPKIKEKADIFEAVLAALYVDGGLEPCKILLNVCFYPRLEMFIINLAWNDPKSQLQQFCLTLRDINDETPDIPEYKVVDSKGPTHKRVYRVAVYFRGNRLAVGTGKSKQQGEMNAAMEALNKSKDLFPNQVSIEDKMTKIVAPTKEWSNNR